MSLVDELRPASYKSVPFLVTATNTPAGIKHVKHVFPNSSNQSIEELGLLQRTYNVTAVITANPRGSGYLTRRDRLLRALEEGGVGTLIHPFYGRLEDIKAVSWTPAETLTAVGEYVTDIVFEVDRPQAVPEAAGFSLSQVFQSVTDFVSAVTTDISSNYGVINSFVSNITDGINQVKQFATAVETNISIASQIPDKITEITEEIQALFDNSVTLALNPDQLGTDTTAIFDTMDDLYSEPPVTLEVMKRFFTFGDEDVPIVTQKTITNQLLFSEEFDNGVYIKTRVTITPDNATAPDSTTTMDLVVPNGDNDSHFLAQNSSVTESLTYTQSVFAKSGGYDFLQIAASTGFNTANAWANFNLATGAVGNVGSLGNAVIENIGSGIFRCSFSAPCILTSANGRMLYAVIDADTASRIPSFIGDTVSGINLWGAQLEISSQVSEYIKTTDTQVTKIVPFSTVVLDNRKNNRDLYRSAIQGTALSYAYLNASRIDFTTVEAIEAEEAELEAQYDKVITAPGLTEETKASLTDQRIITSDFFAEQKLTANQVITVRTNEISTRLLAYQYYGASVENAPIIQDLNNITDVSFISGELEVITA